MKYISTRGKDVERVSSAFAIKTGLARDRGLFMPESIPSLSLDEIKSLIDRTYPERAASVLSKFLDDYSYDELIEDAEAAYSNEKFSDYPAKVTDMKDGGYMLELWHGPTCAFKDMALQILPHFLTKSLQKVGGGRDAVILVATSGDTGKAALEGFKDVDHTKIIVFYPMNGVSAMQKHQMNTQEGENVYVCAIRGNFDDAQTAVKKIFTDPATAAVLNENNMMFSSANSINWGRLLPQIVYYVSAYCDMVNMGKVAFGDKINITVPTGNFGNILAGYYAYEMGLPVNKFICASNSNNVLTDFIRTGVYNKNRDFYTTVSPSMDILVSSNLERLLYCMSGNNDDETKGYMELLKSEGVYTVSTKIKEKLQSMFWGGYADEDATARTIHDLFEQQGYLCDTHTAVAVSVCDAYIRETADKTPVVIASTASPYKFSRAVLSALNKGKMPESEFDMVEQLHEITGADVPKPLASLRGKKVRFSDVTDKEDMQGVVFGALGIR